MLVWLDGGTSKKDKPNENFAREFLELFTLGAGNYTERDIREAARAFTGWVRQDARADTARRRASPATRRRSTTGPKRSSAEPGAGGRPTSSASCSIAPRPRPSSLASSTASSSASLPARPRADRAPGRRDQITPVRDRPVVEIILRSRHFYSPRSLSQRIKSPVEYSAGLVRMLEVPRPALNPLALSAACDAQGQELFAPPNVAGWVGGQHWINSATLLERTNWSSDVIWGRSENGLAPFDPMDWATRYKIDPDRIAQALIDLLLQDDLGNDARRLTLDAGRDDTADGLRKRSSSSSIVPNSNLLEPLRGVELSVVSCQLQRLDPAAHCRCLQRRFPCTRLAAR